MSRILLVQPSLNPPGGGNLVAAWMLEALREEHQVTLLSWTRPDLAACNRTFGTTLRDGDFELRLAPGLLREGMRMSPVPLALLRDSLLLRQARRAAKHHDLVITANNEADLGRRGIQYVHFPRLDPDRPETDLRWYHGSQHLLGLYRRICAVVAGATPTGVSRNVTLVNSAVIGDRIRRLHGVEPEVLHPPIPGPFRNTPWEARDDAFVVIGRISPEKRIETVVEILAGVRAAGVPVRLEVVGTEDDRAYARRVRALVGANADWVRLHENVSRDELLAVIARSRYGIHAMEDEHFGIAVAELVLGGCITFVPDGGGPVEIVGDDERLRFRSVEDATQKILATLADPARQAELRAHLAGRATRFSTERFAARLREIVRAAQ